LAIYAHDPRRLFWWALCASLCALVAFIGLAAWSNRLPENDAILASLLVLVGLFVLSSGVLGWILVFQRSRTQFPGWSVAVGVLLFCILLCFVTLPFLIAYNP
jgi:uncharacterized membrane protein YidH (DUF202 family)